VIVPSLPAKSNLKEIQKISNDKTELTNLLKQIDFISFEENDLCCIQFKEDFTMFSLLNVPANINKRSELQQILKLDDEDRLYKKNLFVWYLVPSNPSKKDNITNTLKTVLFKDEKLKFETYTYHMIKKNISKRIQNIIYNKDSNGLKSNAAAASSSTNTSVSETCSWRKKSMDSEETPFRKGSKGKERTISNFEAPTQFKRKRFNSDADADDMPKFSYLSPHTFLKKECSNAIKHRYNMKQISEIFTANTKQFDQVPTFKNQIEDMCSKERRKLLIIELNELEPLKRDRSRTFHYQDNESKLTFQESNKISIPKNNPLSGF